ncbi:hypothetical protein [Pseudomarimonas salicorniae]|uniref:Uncharacterized protein n=1 Tax=Pseudomarimonas salicorniae TaxID=2933270 RepID=A0ABT0GLE7_9GAMM|nr:hypothetical protein [Lysobacter sp. CAU 1642]MCK7595354.1 hypothetical protein [Lysobacter sp. CAU 1642]
MKTFCCLAAGLLLACANATAESPPPGSASGTFTLNDNPVALRHAYVYREAEGFYDPADPTWTVVFSGKPLAPREVDGSGIDPSLRIGLTLTSEFGDAPSLQVLSQNMYIDGFSLSGGEYPTLALEQNGPEVFSGRMFLPEKQEFFDKTYFYDLRFHAVVVDPDAPIGDALPEGGGEPGAAYIAWTRAVHAKDLKALKALVSPDMAAMLDSPEAAEELEFMALLTPTDVRIVKGSSDGKTAILHIEGKMEGEAVKGEVTMERQGPLWMATSTSMQ